MEDIQSYKPEKAEELLLLITPQMAVALNQENGKGFRYYLSNLLTSEVVMKLEEAPSKTLQNCTSFSISFLNLEKQVIPLTISERFRERILLYLKEGGDEKPFDCNGFVHFINEVPFKFCNFDFEAWELEKLEEGSQLAAEEFVLVGFTNESGDFGKSSHLAFHLGKGLFLGKFGTDSELMVNTLVEMVRGFGGNGVWKIRKK